MIALVIVLLVCMLVSLLNPSFQPPTRVRWLRGIVSQGTFSSATGRLQSNAPRLYRFAGGRRLVATAETSS
jgi:hypothetical protein